MVTTAPLLQCCKAWMGTGSVSDCMKLCDWFQRWPGGSERCLENLKKCHQIGPEISGILRSSSRPPDTTRHCHRKELLPQRHTVNIGRGRG